MKRGWLVMLGLALIEIPCGVGCQTRPSAAVDPEASDAPPVAVSALTPTRTNLQRTTTQPATVHAWFEAKIVAKATGYLSELKADIGQRVKQGDVLAVIAMPELMKQREAKRATIRRMEAEHRRAEAQMAVAAAGVASFQARLEQAKADVTKANAIHAAARIERDRVADLVQRQAVAERLSDEATKRYESAEAETTAAQAAVTTAEAELTLARAEAEAAQAEVAVAQAMIDVAQRELEELDELVKYTQLVAPFDGVVRRRDVDPGDLVRSLQAGSGQDGAPLFVVVQTDKVRVRVAVPERDAPWVDAGDEARVTLQALPGQILEGKVSRAAGSLDEATRTMLVEIDLPNPDGKLLPGMFGQATILLEPPRERILLPANAVRFDEQGKSFVYVINAASEIEVVDVQTGLDDGREIEITAGLSGDQRVVGPLLRRLKAGQKVRVL